MADVAQVVRGFMERGGGHWDPILLLTGPRGCGKTHALADLADRLEDQVPYMYVDCATARGGALGLLTKLAFELNLRGGAYGQLSFPRLVAGLLAVAENLGPDGAARAQLQLGIAFEEYNDPDSLRGAIQRLAADAVAVVPDAENAPGLATTAQYAPELLLDGLLTGRWNRKIDLKPGRDWYGHQDLGLRHDPLRILADLNASAAQADVGAGAGPGAGPGGNQRQATELLCAAFLADLDADFAGKKAWDVNCAVLLDNADENAGLDFLEALAVTRGRRAAHAPGRPDALSVVAGSRGKLVDRVVQSEEGIASLESAGRRHYEQLRANNLVDPGWYPVRLPDLTEAEVRNLVAGAHLHEALGEPVAGMLYRFARGHPGATRLLVRALATAEQPASLAAVLDQPEPAPEPNPGLEIGPGLTPAPGPGPGPGLRPLAAAAVSTVGDRLRRDLIGTAGPAAVRDLVFCSAARDLVDASQLAAASGLCTTPRGTRQNEVFPAELWVSGPQHNVVMLPVLRSLLLRDLADRPADWTKTLVWLCDNSTAAGDTEAVLYYSLALGDTQGVAQGLHEQLKSVTGAQDAHAWLRLLHTVTEAPCESGLDPAEIWIDPGDQPTLTATVGRLVTALWLANNFADADELHGLYQEAAVNLDDIAPHSKGGWMVLRAQAEKYRRTSTAS